MARSEIESCHPYFMLKPYFASRAETFTQVIGEYGVKIHGIYRVPNWSTVSREIYRPTAEREGEAWRVGLETHLGMVRELWGNRAVVVTTDDPPTQDIIDRNLRIKARIRSKLVAGPDCNDLVVMANLDKVNVSNDQGIGVFGQMGVRTPDGGFVPMSCDEGRWDNYYFKYVHAPDSVADLRYESRVLAENSVTSESNRLDLDDFLDMVSLNTFVTPAEMLEARSRRSVQYTHADQLHYAEPRQNFKRS